MDRALSDVISERQRNSNRGRRDRNRNAGPRDGIRKVQPPPPLRPAGRGIINQARPTCGTASRDTSRNIDHDWVHDKFDDDNETTRGAIRSNRHARRLSPEYDTAASTAAHAKLRIDNLHYDLTEEDLSDLFSQLAPLPTPPTIRYDRAGRSTGVAFITYASLAAAKQAIRDFDSANANGQPIYLTLLSAGGSDRPRARNPFDTARLPSKSLFERVSARHDHDDDDEESEEGDRVRPSDVSGPPPKNIDRYVPGQGSSRSRSRSRTPPPPRARRTGGGGDGGRRAEGGRRPGAGGRRDGRDGDKPRERNGRPRKTQEELDREMEDYWGERRADVPAETNASGGGDGADVDMIE